MPLDRFPKQGTEAYYVYKAPDTTVVVRVKLTKKWIDKLAYSIPTQVVTVRVVELVALAGKQVYQKNRKIIIDELEDLIFDNHKLVEKVFDD